MKGLWRGFTSWRESRGRQTGALVRNTLRGFLENELTSAEGNPVDTLTNIVGLLAAGGVCVSWLFIRKYCFLLSEAPRHVRWAVSWSDVEFLTSLSMAVTSFATVLAWDSLFPDRRDSLILATLPVRMRTVFAARVLSILLLPVFCVAAADGVSSTVFLLCYLDRGTSILEMLRNGGALFLSLSAAGLFAFFSLVALQGVLVNILSYRQFRWLASWVQLGVLLTILSLFLLMPKIADPHALSDPEKLKLALWLPPFWFLGLHQWMLGYRLTCLDPLVAAAVRGLVTAVSAALLLYAVGCRRHVRNALEEPDLGPKIRGARTSVVSEWFKRKMIPNLQERAVFTFVSLTMRRGRRSRLLLAVAGAVGMSYVFDGLATLLHGSDKAYWVRPSAEVAAIPLVFAFFMLLGMRVLFTLPEELRANWVFRLTEPSRPAHYLAGVRKVMLCYGMAPVVVVLLPIYGLLWGWWTACQHLLLVALILWIVVETLLMNFNKIPFTCAFLPGQSNLKLKFGFYWVLFSLASYAITNIEAWLLGEPVAYLVAVVLLAYAVWRVRRERENRERWLAIAYEPVPGWVLIRLGLSA